MSGRPGSLTVHGRSMPILPVGTATQKPHSTSGGPSTGTLSDRPAGPVGLPCGSKPMRSSRADNTAPCSPGLRDTRSPGPVPATAWSRNRVRTARSMPRTSESRTKARVSTR